ncbi:hypothetical protein A5782_08405 [Mycobacterium sp. 852002-40037_SCH5390672]|nr:hypothetical protein A5782_08405 [Mycobacterium sp. 852002-40037_SCH5390672]
MITNRRGQRVAQTFRPYIGPGFFDVMHACGAVGFPKNYSPTGRNDSKYWPKTVLFFVIDQNEKTAIVVIERIERQRMNPLTPT